MGGRLEGFWERSCWLYVGGQLEEFWSCERLANDVRPFIAATRRYGDPSGQREGRDVDFCLRALDVPAQRIGEDMHAVEEFLLPRVYKELGGGNLQPRAPRRLTQTSRSSKPGRPGQTPKIRAQIIL